MSSQLILVLLMTFSVDSLPVGNRKQRSANDPSAIVTMSKSIHDLLIENDETEPVGLYAVYDNAEYLKKEDLFKPEV